MSTTDHKPRGGFLHRIFGRSTPVPGDGGRTEAGEIPMSLPGETTVGKRLARPKSVLVIAPDDSAPRRWRKEMETVGYGVESVSDAAKGLDILYGFSFDALFIDFTAPGVNGLNVLRQIRCHDELKSLFIGVFIREKDAEADFEMAALDAGANRVFPRGSVKPDEILTALKTALFPRVLQAQPRARQAGATPAPATARTGVAPAQPPPPKAAPATAAPVVPAEAASASTELPALLPVAASTVPMPPPRRTFRVPPPEMGKSGQPMPTVIHKKILIIDADESVAAIYRAQIEAAGYEVEVALDGETGFHDLYTINPDALLLDLLLPGGMSGSEILKKTRAQKKFEKIPILVFTNIYTRDVEEEARAAGALRLFNKAAATPHDVITALHEIFLPSGAVFGAGAAPGSFAAPAAAAVPPTPGIKFDLPPLVVGSSSPATVPRPSLPAPPSIQAPVPVSPVEDSEFQKEIRESLLQGAPEFVKSLRGQLQVLLRSQSDHEAQAVQLLEMYTRVHSLTGNAAIAGFTKVARLSGALEAMLREFQTKPEGLNASTKRTLTQAMDFLARLFTNAATHESDKALDEKILVVDDEIISRRVIGHSLEKAGLRSTAVSHPDEALKLLQDHPYDLIFLDVEMPGMNGFELCKRLRAMPLHAGTPVIFVTALNGFESRAKSSLSGGDDFIGKPFSYIELAVKGLIYVLKGAIGEKHTRPAAKERGLPAAASAAPSEPVVVSA